LLPPSEKQGGGISTSLAILSN